MDPLLHHPPYSDHHGAAEESTGEQIQEQNQVRPQEEPSHEPSSSPATSMEVAPLQNDAETEVNGAEPPTQNGKDAEAPTNDTGLLASASESLSESDPTTSNDTEKPTPKSADDEEDEEEEEEEELPPKKQKALSSLGGPQLPEDDDQPATAMDVDDSKNDNNIASNDAAENPTTATTTMTTTPATAATTTAKKKSKKKSNNNVWVTRSTRKGKKKAKPSAQNTPAEDKVLITPVPRFPDKNDDSPELKICLSKVYKAEKVELSEDRMSAGSTKGYRMVRATRGVCEGAWYFEIKVVHLGETGHTRLGWSTEKGDLQAPVGYDGNSFGYRDVDGSKVHKALREKYGEEDGYKEGDVIGFYINLPEGGQYAPKAPHLVWYKGQRYVCAPDAKEDPPKIVPGSEISFFKNGVCQGVAFKDLFGGRYYPAASMYTLPNQANCEVRFNFGPDFEFDPEDFGGRAVPRPMIEVPYHGFDSRVENGTSDDKTH